MFTLNAPSIALFLQVIVIIHSIFATPEIETCRELLGKEYYFKDGQENKQQNFINAFINLSYKKIDQNYSEPPEYEQEDNAQRAERELRHKLTRSYFEDLFENHGLDNLVSGRQHVYQWCKSVVRHAISTNDFAYHMMIDSESEVNDCHDFIFKLLKSFDDIKEPLIIFQRLYEDWTLDSINKDEIGLGDIRQLNFSLHDSFVLDVKIEHHIKTYSLEFFKHYQDIFDDIDPRAGNFSSIEDYCRVKGHIIVRDSGYVS